MSQVISANRLRDGAVVYFSDTGAWAVKLSQARIFAGKAEAEAGLLSAQNDVKRNLVVDPAAVEVTQAGGGLRPVTLRESIRALGPTIDFLPRAQAFVHEAHPPPDSVSRQETHTAWRGQPLESAHESVG